MAISSLDHQGDVSVEQFEQMFGTQLGDDFPRVLEAFNTFGPMHSYRMSNLLHLSLQKGNTAKIVSLMLEWYEIFQTAPDEVTAHTDTRMILESMYTEFLTDLMDPEISKTIFVPVAHSTPKEPVFRSKMWVVRNSQN